MAKTRVVRNRHIPSHVRLSHSQKTNKTRARPKFWHVSSHRQSRCQRATRSLAMFTCSHRLLYSLALQQSTLLRSTLIRSTSLRTLRSLARSFIPLTPSWDGWNSRICVHAVNAFDMNNRLCCRHSKHALYPTLVREFFMSEFLSITTKEFLASKFEG